jgi:hypothetical protein
MAREKLSPEEIAETFQNAISSWVKSKEEIDKDLSKADQTSPYRHQG